MGQTMSEHRGHKQHEYEHIGDQGDFISNLPDCILHHILSLMTTKEAVKTSILSTRWKNLWAFVPNIDFYDNGLLLSATEVDGRPRPEVTSFVNFVERVLRLRDPSSNMDKFHLRCFVCNNASKIHSWISDAIMHNVQELDLTLFGVNPSAIPRSMFGSTSLVTLKISMFCAIELPSHVSFPCLKTLHLSFVWFSHHDFTKKLLSGCPVLEELVLSRNYWRHLNNFVISSSTLKSLIILRKVSPFGAVNDRSGCKINVDAPNLTYFEYIGFLSNQIFLNNTPSLDDSFIDIPNPGERVYEVASRAIGLIKQLQYVVSLMLSNRTMETLLFADILHFPVFQNLTHLMLTMEIGMNHTFRVLMRLLSFCPVLESICFSEGFVRNMRRGENTSIWSSIPVCMKNCLKTVTLQNFHGYNSEICFLKCVLKYACGLERMDICWSETYLMKLKRKTEVMKDLVKSERSSTASVIKFS